MNAIILVLALLGASDNNTKLIIMSDGPDKVVKVYETESQCKAVAERLNKQFAATHDLTSGARCEVD